MNEDKHPEIRVRVSMFGDFRFSHLSGILWECGTAERSEASTALVARTRVRAKKIWQRALPKPKRSSRCVLHMGIHPDSRRSSYFFVPFFIVIEPGCYRSFLFIIWLNCYGHHIGYLTYQWGNILNRRSNNLFLMCMTVHSHISLPFSFHSSFFSSPG